MCGKTWEKSKFPVRFRITAGNNIVNQTAIYLRNVGLNEPASQFLPVSAIRSNCLKHALRSSGWGWQLVMFRWPERKQSTVDHIGWCTLNDNENISRSQRLNIKLVGESWTASQLDTISPLYLPDTRSNSTASSTLCLNVSSLANSKSSWAGESSRSMPVILLARDWNRVKGNVKLI